MNIENMTREYNVPVIDCTKELMKIEDMAEGNIDSGIDITIDGK